MAKAGTELLYAGSNEIDEVAWYAKNSEYSTHKVAQKKPNAWGIYDCSGHLFEWCHDEWKESRHFRYSELKIKIKIDPCEYKSEPVSRSIRGGRWDHAAENCEVAKRDSSGPFYHSHHIGFRILKVCMSQ